MEHTQEIFTDRILLPDDNMRTEINRDELHELSDDIKKNGLINPITVRPKGEHFELVAGQRRLLACQIAGILKVPCVVRELTDEQALAIMTSENLARVDVNPVDEARHVGRLLAQYDGDTKRVAGIVGRSVKWVEDRILVASMPDYMQEFLSKGQIKLGVALALLQIETDDTRYAWTLQAVRDGVSVGQAEYWLHGWRISQLPGATPSETPPDGYTPDAPRVVMFRCALTGNEHDCRQFQSVMLHETSIPIFQEFVRLYRSSASEIEKKEGGDE